MLWNINCILIKKAKNWVKQNLVFLLLTGVSQALTRFYPLILENQ